MKKFERIPFVLGQWIEAKRIIAADPSIRMSAVATAVGIPLPYNFSRWFKAVTGMTANSWRFLCRASKAEKL